MKKLYLYTIVLVMLVSSSACSPTQTESDPSAVIEAMESAWNAKDVEGVLALYADGAVETNPMGVFVGKTEIRGYIQAWIEKFSLDCENYSVSRNHVRYEYVGTYYLDPDGSKIGARYEAVIENGKIKATILIDTFTP